MDRFEKFLQIIQSLMGIAYIAFLLLVAGMLLSIVL